MIRTHDETSTALLEAAHRLLASDGADALTVRRIASEANMSTMNVYSRFGGKDGVIDELYVDGFRRLGAELDAVANSGDPRNDLRLIANRYRDFARNNPTYYGIMFRSTIPGFEASPESVELALSALVSLVARIDDAQQKGQISESSDPAKISAWLWATCHGLVSLELDGIGEESVSWPDTWEFGLEMALSALVPSDSSAHLP